MPDTPARNKAAVPAAVALVAALITGVVLLAPLLAGGSGESNGSAGRPVSDVSRDGSRPPADPENDPFARLVRRDPEDPTALGEPDAPVVMINYSEFQCPFCGKFARDTEPTLVEEFVEDGTLRIEWRDFPYLGPESTTAAQAGRAAGAQGKFWEFHDAMFADQQPPNSGNLTEEYLVGVAEQIGLDTKKFRKDMSSAWAADAVAKDFDEGQQIGVTGTPAFLVNGRPIMGAQPTDVFVDAIEQAAEAAE
ncbi:MAG TPA: thioredoxin domain-containing protein [Nocardioidaceae bacterium]|nr:thioredoxin domain-containing protein [Nocardioidaceae bacterium]